jgi:autotransporter-associated beta strand protein
VPTANDIAYIVNGGTTNVTQLGQTCGTLSLGNSANSGTVQMTAGSLSIIANESIGASGNGVFAPSDGTHSVSDSLFVGDLASGSGTYNLSGGRLDLSTSGLTQGIGTAVFNFGGGTLGASAPWSSSLDMTLTGSRGNSIVDTTGGDISLSGNLSGGGSLAKVGGGTLVLSGSDSYTGGTIVEAGTLILTSKAAIADGTSLIVGDARLFAPVMPSDSAVSPVPEPGTLALLIAGAALLAPVIAFRNAALTCWTTMATLCGLSSFVQRRGRRRRRNGDGFECPRLRSTAQSIRKNDLPLGQSGQAAGVSDQ